jgi:hypothetical protein
VVAFLADTGGQESLGIGYVALYLKAAPPGANLVPALDALGTMADRLAQRASVRVAHAGDATLAAELEVAESYGVHFASFSREGVTRVCYDGEAFRRVVALGAAGPARVRALLGLTDPACVDPAAGATAALALTKWRSELLHGVDFAALGAEVTPDAKARLHLRRSMVGAALAYLASRTGDLPLAKEAGEMAHHELALTDRAALADEDRAVYQEAALRASAARWAGEALPPPAEGQPLEVTIAPGEPGQTCLRVKARATPQAPPFEHCTYGVVSPGSLRLAPRGTGLVVAVQPIDGWSELLYVHQGAAGWVADSLTPALTDPDVGYVELAGFSPDGAQLLVVREARVSGPLGSPHTLAPWIRTVFQVVRASDLHVEKDGPGLASVGAAKGWQTADWRRGTLALR